MEMSFVESSSIMELPIPRRKSEMIIIFVVVLIFKFIQKPRFLSFSSIVQLFYSKEFYVFKRNIELSLSLSLYFCDFNQLVPCGKIQFF